MTLVRLPFASFARRSRSVFPATSASNMARPEMPSTSATMFASLMLAVSSSLCTRLAAWTRSRMRLFRCRVRSRKSRIGGGGMKLRMSPCARRFAIRAVLHIGLPARHGLHVVRIGQDYLKAPFKEVEDGFPVHACGLHRHVCARPRATAAGPTLGHESGCFVGIPAFHTVRVHCRGY